MVSWCTWIVTFLSNIISVLILRLTPFSQHRTYIDLNVTKPYEVTQYLRLGMNECTLLVDVRQSVQECVL